MTDIELGRIVKWAPCKVVEELDSFDKAVLDRILFHLLSLLDGAPIYREMWQKILVKLDAA